MMSELAFTILVYLIWGAATIFGALILYWFIVEGFSEKGYADRQEFPREEWSYTRNSLLIWLGFVLAILLMIILGG